jgi:hypothetical protein
MRYHKAISISKVEADFLIDGPTTSVGEYIVVQILGEWYDVRQMTERELNAFVDDVQRSYVDDVTAGFLDPH